MHITRNAFEKSYAKGQFQLHPSHSSSTFLRPSFGKSSILPKPTRTRPERDPNKTPIKSIKIDN